MKMVGDILGGPYQANLEAVKERVVRIPWMPYSIEIKEVLGSSPSRGWQSAGGQSVGGQSGSDQSEGGQSILTESGGGRSGGS